MTDSMFRYYAATVGTIWFVVVVTLASELFPPVKALIADIFLHHWLGKSILTLVVFGALVAVASDRRVDERRWANYIIVSVVAGSLLILGYYVVHYLST